MGLEEILKKHIEDEDKKLAEITGMLTALKDNHFQHLAASFSDLKLDLAETRTDIKWLKWLMMASIGSALGQVMAILFK